MNTHDATAPEKNDSSHLEIVEASAKHAEIWFRFSFQILKRKSAR
jgi:hypothetical protein